MKVHIIFTTKKQRQRSETRRSTKGRRYAIFALPQSPRKSGIGTAEAQGGANRGPQFECFPILSNFSGPLVGE